MRRHGCAEDLAEWDFGPNPASSKTLSEGAAGEG